MHHVLLTAQRLAIAKTKLKKNLGIKSGHLSEAIARGLGAASHAAILADLRKNDHLQKRDVVAADFLSRLDELGCNTDQAQAEAAFFHALLPYTTKESELIDPFSIRATFDRIADAKKRLRRSSPWTQDILSYEDAPDLTIKTIRIDRDIWRWHPVFLKQFDDENLEFIVFNAAVHRVLGHGARRGYRDATAWNIACELIVNDALIHWKIGEPFLSINWDGRYDRRLSAEEAFDKMGEDILGKEKPSTRFSWFEQGAWSSTQTWPTSAYDVYDTKAASLPLDGHGDIFRTGAQPQPTPAVVSAVVVETTAALRDLMYLPERPGTLPSAAPVKFVLKFIEENISISAEEVPALIAEHSWLLTMSLRGESICQSIETAFRGMAMVELADSVEEAIGEAWSETTFATRSTISDALSWLADTYPKPFPAINLIPLPHLGPSEKGADNLFKAASYARETIMLSACNKDHEYKKVAQVHLVRLHQILVELEVIQQWYRSLDRLREEAI